MATIIGKAPAEKLAEAVAEFPGIVQHLYLSETESELCDLVTRIADDAFLALRAVGDDEDDELIDEPDALLAGAAAETCWLVRQFAEDLRMHVRTLTEAAEQFDKVATTAWFNFETFGCGDTRRAA